MRLKGIRNAAAPIRQMILHAVVRKIGQSIGGDPGERRYTTAYSHLSINERSQDVRGGYRSKLIKRPQHLLGYRREGF